MRSKPSILLSLALLLLVGCAHNKQPTTPKPPALPGEMFEDKQHGFSINVPEKWKSTNNKNSEDVLTLAGEKDVELTIAVPKLPPHIPGIIPLPGVESGYVDDVKKRMQDVKTTESNAVKVAGATARKFAIEGKANGKQIKLLAIAIVKGDALYIVTGEGPADQFDAVKSAVEEVEKSWKWNK